MARRRTIHGKISLNRELAELDPFSCLTFTWGLAHCDDWGVISGDPVIFRAQVFPLRTESIAQVEGAIDQLVSAGLVQRYERDGKLCLYYPSWDDHQEGLHKRTRSRTELPLPHGHPMEVDGKDPRRPESSPQADCGKLGPVGSEQSTEAQKTLPQVDTGECSETFSEVPGNSGKFPPKGSEGKLNEGNTHLTPARAREGDAPLACPEGPRGVCELCDTEPDTSTPDGETTAPAPAPEPPAAETIPTTDETPAPQAPPAPARKPPLEQQHKPLWKALEGAYPQRRDRERRRMLDCYLRELAAPGCLITEAQLVECLESDPPLAGGTPQQYLLHAQGRVTGRRSRDAPAAETDGGRERVGVEAVLAAAGVAEVDEGQVAQAAEHGQQVLARFRRRAGPGDGQGAAGVF